MFFCLLILKSRSGVLFVFSVQLCAEYKWKDQCEQFSIFMGPEPLSPIQFNAGQSAKTGLLPAPSVVLE